jgi:hypothetical protein
MHMPMTRSEHWGGVLEERWGGAPRQQGRGPFLEWRAPEGRVAAASRETCPPPPGRLLTRRSCRTLPRPPKRHRSCPGAIYVSRQFRYAFYDLTANLTFLGPGPGGKGQVRPAGGAGPAT